VEQKSSQDVEEEGKILSEILEIVEQRNCLTNQLEEDRQRCCDWLLVLLVGIGVVCLYLGVRLCTHSVLASLLSDAHL
jgi:Bivalent Mical/EHBP Rab binding domain